MEMEDSDLVPVKDTRGGGGAGEAFKIPYDRHLAGEKRAVSLMPRPDLEDAYLRLHDDHLLLKKHSIRQEEKIKKLVTKLSRLIKDKKLEAATPEPASSLTLAAKGKEVELTEKVNDLQDTILELEKVNSQLRNKLALVKQQVPSPRTKKPLNLQTKVKIGLNAPPSLTSQPIEPKSNPPKRPHSSSSPNYAIHLVEAARTEMIQLEEMVARQATQIDDYQRQIASLKDKMGLMETDFEEEVRILKEKYLQEQRLKSQENMELITLHRELNDKNAELSGLRPSLEEIQQRYQVLKKSHEQLQTQIKTLTLQLQDLQNQNFDLQTEIRSSASTVKRTKELQEQVRSLQNEISILEETNIQLMDAPRQQEQNQRKQILLLETQLQQELAAKDQLAAQLRTERENLRKKERSLSELQNDCELLQEEVEELQLKLEEMSKMPPTPEPRSPAPQPTPKPLSPVTPEHLTPQPPATQHNLEFLAPVPPEEDPSEKQLKKAMLELSDTRTELEKVRSMLSLQYQINQECQAELATVRGEMERQSAEYEARLQEYARHLDHRAAIIQKLEKQLKDIAYGTTKTQVRVRDDSGEADTFESFDIPKGQNLLEIHIDKMDVAPRGLETLQSTQPITFLTWCFFEFQLQSTPVLKGPSPRFNITAQYKVTIDDFFLHYLEKDKMSLELHQALGLDYRTVARGYLDFAPLLDPNIPPGNQHVKQVALVDVNQTNQLVATVELWLRLHLPLEQALLLYKEKTKALSYLQQQHLPENQLPAPPPEGTNILHVKIEQCSGLPNSKNGEQPSSYCMYKLYDLPDQDTTMVPFSNCPVFQDHRTFPLAMDTPLDHYLRTQELRVYVFDDNDQSVGSYLGLATISLLPLAHNHQLQGYFPLVQAKGGESVGHVEVGLHWEMTYLPPKASLDIPRPREMKESAALVQELPRLHPQLAAKVPHRPTRGPEAPPSMLEGGAPARRVVKGAREDPTGGRMSGDAPIPAPRRSVPAETQSQQIEEVDSKSEASQNSFDELSIKELPSSQTKRPEESKYIDDFDDDEEEMEEKEESSGSSTRSEENFGVVVADSAPLSQSDQDEADAMVIAIHQLRFFPAASVLSDPAVQMVYVEYTLLDFPPEDLETPFSLPKCAPPNFVAFNFHRVFKFDSETNLHRREKLKELLESKDRKMTEITFTLVSDPAEDSSGEDCEDLASASVYLKDILESGQDLTEQNITLVSPRGAEDVGELRITVQCHALLRSLSRPTD